MNPFDVHYPVNSRIEEKGKDLRASRDNRRGKKLNFISPTEQGCVTKWC